MTISNHTTPQRWARGLQGFAVLSLFYFLLAPILAMGQDGPQITFQLSPFNVPGSLETVVNGTDGSGNMVGVFTDQQSSSHGFLYTPTGQLTVIDHPNFSATVCYGVAGSSSVVGVHVTPAGLFQAFSWSQGVFTDIVVPGAVSSIAYGINDKGVIVGTYIDKNNVHHGWEWTGARFKNIDVPGMVDTVALAINHSGMMTFGAFDADGIGHGFLKKGKTYTQIDSPNGIALLGLSDSGDIAATIFDRQGAAHGALYLKDGWHFYDQPGAFGTWITGVNRNRNLVGYFQSTDNQTSLEGLRGSYLP